MIKITTLLVFVTCFTVSASVYSQNAKVTLHTNGKTIRYILNQLENQTNYKFVYNNNFFNADSVISITAKNIPLKEVLSKIINPSGFTYKVNKELIVIYQTPAANDERTISGTVVDKKGEPLPGVTVTDASDKHAVTVTDVNGRYRLKVSDKSVRLIFSFIGFVTQTVNITGVNTINISLDSQDSKLNEVLVIGYGSTTKRNATGATGRINSDVISKQPVASPLQALQGRIPGVFIVAGSGRPGANTTVTIRGRNSIGAGTDPLYIVDGVPYQSNALNQYNPLNTTNGNQSPLNSINPDDIESIDVLKDADATSIYGSRAANGVILITTKKAKFGMDKVVISGDISSGISQVAHQINMLSTSEYLAMRRQAIANDKLTPTAGNAPDLLLFDQNAETNWQKFLIGRDAHYTNAQVNLSGSTAQSRFYIGSSFRREGYVFPGAANDKRVALHATYDYNSKDNKFGLSLINDFSNDQNNGQHGDASMNIFTPPNFNAYTETGTLNFNGILTNPIASLLRPYNVSTQTLISNAILRYNFAKGLNFKVSLGYNDQDFGQLLKYPSTSFAPGAVQRLAYFGTTLRRSYSAEPQLDYSTHLGKGVLQLLLGGTYQNRTNKSTYLIGSNYSTDELLGSIKGASTITVGADTETNYKYASVFGRATYNWDETYILNGTLRRDGSSRFGPDRQFGYFGSVGAGWIFSNEKLIKNNLGFLSFGKLRASYGTTGNDQIADYGYYSKYAAYANPYAGIAALYPTSLESPGFSWEKVEKLDMGIDLGFFKDRLVLNADYYRNRTSNQLVSQTLPATTGFSSIQVNLPAVIQNRGWEFDINSKNITGKFSWNTGFNITLPDNKLLSFENFATSTYARTYELGRSLNIVRGYEFNGVDPATGLANIGNYIILGQTDPKLYGGLTNDFQYRNFQLSVFFQFVKQDGYNYLNGRPAFGMAYNVDKDFLNYWKNPGDQVDIPKPTTISTTTWSRYTSSTATFGDASYARIKNVQLSYQVPADFAKKARLSSCRIYLQGQNLFTFTRFKGMDPETEGNYMPTLRVISAGIQLTL